jgi:hypothetical protein
VTRHCGKCGRRWRRDARFCSSCGSPRDVAVDVKGRSEGWPVETKKEAEGKTDPGLPYRVGAELGGIIGKGNEGAKVLGGLLAEVVVALVSPPAGTPGGTPGGAPDERLVEVRKRRAEKRARRASRRE